MNKKFKLTDITSHIFGRKVYQIEALRDFSDVRKGELGGWVEKEANLSQIDDCWVYGDGAILQDAKVSGDAIVSESARVFETAEVFGKARVHGNAWVFQDAVIHGDADIGGKAEISGRKVIVEGNYYR